MKEFSTKICSACCTVRSNQLIKRFKRACYILAWKYRAKTSKCNSLDQRFKLDTRVANGFQLQKRDWSAKRQKNWSPNPLQALP